MQRREEGGIGQGFGGRQAEIAVVHGRTGQPLCAVEFPIAEPARLQCRIQTCLGWKLVLDCGRQTQAEIPLCPASQTPSVRCGSRSADGPGGVPSLLGWRWGDRCGRPDGGRERRAHGIPAGAAPPRDRRPGGAARHGRGAARAFRRSAFHRCRLCRPCAADRLRADHQPALCGGLHDRAAWRCAPSIGCSKSAPARATRRRCCRGSPARWSASSATARWRTPREAGSRRSATTMSRCWLATAWPALPARAPFDRIIVTAAAESIPQALTEQLADERRHDAAARAACRARRRWSS